MKSIAMKLWLGMMGLVAVILVLLWLFQIVFLDSFYIGIQIHDVKSAGADVLKDIGDMDTFEKRLEELANQKSLTVELVNASSVIYLAGETNNQSQMPMSRNQVRQEILEKVLSGETAMGTMMHPRFNTEFELIGLPAQLADGEKAALLITLPLAPVEETAGILKQQLLYISMILLVFTLLFSFMLARSFTKRILDISRVAEKMASGDLTARARTGGRDEIGRLAETINHMGSELTKLEQLRKDLIANVSHELRTPLSLIKGYAETIRDVTGGNPEKREKQLGIIIEESDRLSGIVGDILNLSQMQAGYLPVKNAAFGLDNLIGKVMQRYEVLSEKNGIDLRTAGDFGFLVKGDETKLEQVLYNLINNAFSHTNPGGSIEIGVTGMSLNGTGVVGMESEGSPDRLWVSVADTGVGIPPEELPFIWDRFHKGNGAGKKRSGTGLGLAIVKSILEAHQSEYGVESKPGEGTTFWFTINKAGTGTKN